jgi:hypothetical protein
MKTWTVQSRTNPENTYQVSMITPYHWECTCPNYQFRKSDCKHIKAIQKKYDQQNKKHRRDEVKNQQEAIQNNHREPGDRRDSLPERELRRDSDHNGEQTNLPKRDDKRPGGADLPSQHAETSLGKPDTSPDLPRSSQTKPNAETKGSAEDCTENLKQQLLREKQKQIKLKEQWETRITEYSKDDHKKLAQLKQQYKATKERSKREIIILQAKVIKMGIRASNKKDFKSKCPFPTNLIETDIEALTEEECQQYKMFIALD